MGLNKADFFCPLQAHVSEIFSAWGQVKSVEMPKDHMHPELHRGYAYIDFTTPQAASDAVNYMNGGQIDGQEVNVTEVMPRPPPSQQLSRSARQFSPARRRSQPETSDAPSRWVLLNVDSNGWANTMLQNIATPCWVRGTLVACHAGDPGSILGQRTIKMIINNAGKKQRISIFHIPVSIYFWSFGNPDGLHPFHVIQCDRLQLI